MKPAQAAVLGLSSVLFAIGCASAPKETSRPRTPRPPNVHDSKTQYSVLESHLSGEWLKAATRLQPAEAVIYYQGDARSDSGEGEPWTGTVNGDILFVSPQRAIVIPGGTLTVGKDNSVKVFGPASTFTASSGENPSWRALLPM